ncbi:MAG: ribosomal protein S18-alanine N-acetyltransferase [Gammaproteobacteria bacterium]|jgi:ribosomal-protein-alanine N-acetyltransferase
MSAVIKQDELYLRPMSEEDLVFVVANENRAYEFPWSETIFQDCLHVGYCSWVLECDGNIIAHTVMSVAAGEAHILNICVHPDYQGQGLGRKLLEHLLELVLDHNVDMMFLEVRPTNFGAIKLYLDVGFDEIGMRRNYYPAKMGWEDALVFAKAVIKD